MFGKLATLLMMAWEENPSLRYFVSFFTLTSNVVAVNVFLNGAHPQASCLVVLGALAAKALARALQSVFLPSLEVCAFGRAATGAGGSAQTLSVGLPETPFSLLLSSPRAALSLALELVT
ncbi:hypothetical protein BESB_010240 [Besnoitia besnoiti]|uniref:Uncharacterized protein n=1 Tax=Besnoitia besnoiti TaxID=94643 RepID=A0A2A9MR11_BESBE|nr:hypothetical protein BESB_010240 [Besnoitia besnoiti]PFH38682.1 hypothetical protein BESB_010240 [Besnoitia besnoiti]